ncbi:hypothetical protein QFC19_001513 [Naganishia cerealis]|uniref:Uncharacterized protein n=1 Tax=Naganishia cerealis TaxID=610337 RepID=A0ACC2WHQ1_9TREE|nr:hypothetical protein QFC19_001513 [Naganishia cerealis]
MSSLLQTAISNRQAASQTPGSPAAKPAKGSPSKKFAKLSLSSDDDERHSTDGNEDDDFPEDYDDDDDDDDEDELVDLQTRPGTPVPGGAKSAGLPSPSGGSGMRSLSGKLTSSRDPLRILPSALAVRVFLQLDIRSLARCNRVFVDTRKKLQPGEPDPEDPNSGFDPYDKYRGLPILATPLPTSSTPQWSKRESKKEWRPIFKELATRKDTDLEKRDPLQVDVDALSATVSPIGSGYSTPNEGWGGNSGGGSGTLTPSKSKKEMRAHYKSLNGRKSKSKGMLGGTARGHKDLGGAGETDDPYSAPF